MSTPRLRIVVAAVLVAVVCVVGGAFALGGGSSSTLVPTELQVTSAITDASTSTTLALAPTTTAGRGTTIKPTTTTRPTTNKGTAAGARDGSGLLIVTPAQLPAEARRTLALIASGGPYPYERDGIEFGNREGRLPKRASGYYHEYTVVTPGSGDRGARRVIAGANGERYYTGDHYETFVRVSTSGRS
jgi:ribonuclease T1